MRLGKPQIFWLVPAAALTFFADCRIVWPEYVLIFPNCGHVKQTAKAAEIYPPFSLFVPAIDGGVNI
jgi:hypothetical protein